MAATQTAFNACNAAIIAADNLGVDHDISGTVNKVEVSLTRDVKDYVVFGDANHWRLSCKKDGQVTIDIVASKDTFGGLNILSDWYDRGDFRHFRAMAPSSAIGSKSVEGYFLVTDLKMPMDAADAGPIMISATLVPNGPITISTVSTS